MNRVHCILATLVLFAGLTSVHALPEGGQIITKSWAPGAPRAAEVQWRQVDNKPFKHAAEVVVKKPGQNDAQNRITVPVTRDIEAGDVLHLRFWGRSVRGSRHARVGVIVGPTGETSEPLLRDRSVWLNEWWWRFDAAFRAKRAIKADKAAVTLQTGYRKQKLQIGGLALRNYGPEGVKVSDLPGRDLTYPGRSQDAPWREAARRRIQKHRKSKLTVRVVDENGKPVDGAHVNAAMQRHAFGFGAAVKPELLDPDRDSSADISEARQRDLTRYRRIIERHFNKVVFEHGFRWHQWFRPRRAGRLDEHKAMLDAAMQWCKSRNIAIRGHYLAWGTMNRSYKFPDDYESHPDRLWPDLKAHIERKLAFTDGRIPEWDAVNHPVGWGPKTFADITGGPDIYAKTIKLGASLTDAEMWINEGGVVAGDSRLKAYLQLLEQLIDRDARPYGVGFMCHFSPDELISPKQVYSVFDRFAKPGVKLQITELDVDTRGAEQVQADYYRDVLTIAFSHPAMEGVVMWGFWAGNHWQPQTALWRGDWSIKPAGEAWRELVLNRWWTEASGKTGADGTYATDGFHGSYAITVRHEGTKRRVTHNLQDGGSAVVVRLDG